MKKLFLVLAVASLGFVSCNNEASEAEKAKEDSIAAAAKADSIKKAEEAAMPPVPTPAEIEAKRIADSTRIADSLKALPKK
jgi:hypothetical protein